MSSTRPVTSTLPLRRASSHWGGAAPATTEETPQGRHPAQRRAVLAEVERRDWDLVEFVEDAESFSSKYRQNRLSGGFGLPIVKDKAFAFGAFTLSRRTNDLMSLLSADSVTLQRLGTDPALVDRFLGAMNGYGIPATLPRIPRDALVDNVSGLVRATQPCRDHRPPEAGPARHVRVLGVAAWMRYVGGVDEQGQPIDVRDPNQLRLLRTLGVVERILVTGSAGHLGEALVRVLSERGHPVVRPAHGYAFQAIGGEGTTAGGAMLLTAEGYRESLRRYRPRVFVDGEAVSVLPRRGWRDFVSPMERRTERCPLVGQTVVVGSASAANARTRGPIAAKRWSRR